MSSNFYQKYFKKNVPSKNGGVYRLYHEFFYSYIDQIIKKNYQELFREQYCKKSLYISSPNKHYMIHKKKLHIKPPRFSARFIKSELDKWRTLSQTIFIYIRSPNLSYDSLQQIGIQYIPNPLHIGTRVLASIYESFDTFRSGVIDTLYFMTNYHRIKLDQLYLNAQYILSDETSFMVLDPIDFIKISTTPTNSSNLLSRSTSIYETLSLTDSDLHNKTNVCISIIKIQKILDLKLKYLIQLNLLNDNIEHQFPPHSDKDWSFKGYYTQVIYYIDHIDKQLEFCLPSLIDNVSTIGFLTRRELYYHYPEINTREISLILNEIEPYFLFVNIIHLLLAYMCQLKSSDTYHRINVIQTITSRLYVMIPKSCRPLLESIYSKLCNISF